MKTIGELRVSGLGHDVVVNIDVTLAASREWSVLVNNDVHAEDRLSTVEGFRGRGVTTGKYPEKVGLALNAWCCPNSIEAKLDNAPLTRGVERIVLRLREELSFGGHVECLHFSLDFINAVIEEAAFTLQLVARSAAIIEVVRRALIISVPVILMRICLTKYNAERHLRILYDHRTAAIDQFNLFESSIAEGESGKAELRIEAAKMILSDPATNYSSSADGSDINISPIFSALRARGSSGSPRE